MEELKELLLNLNAKMDLVLRRLNELETKPPNLKPATAVQNPVGDIGAQIEKMRQELMAKHGMGNGMPNMGAMGAAGAMGGFGAMGGVDQLTNMIKGMVPKGKKNDDDSEKTG